MVNFLSEKCYLKFHVGEDKPNQGKKKTNPQQEPLKSKTTPSWAKKED